MSRCSLLLAGVLLVGPECLLAQAPVKVTGVVKQLDATVGTVTVQPSRKDAKEESFNLLKRDLPVTLPNGEKVPLDSVQPGQAAQFVLNGEGDVEAILLQANVYTATIREMDLTARTLTLAGDDIAARTLAVPPNAKITIADRPVHLREVKVGSAVTVSASPDGKTALGFKVISDPDGKYASKLYTRIKSSRLPGLRLTGVLSNIDAAKKGLTLTGPKTKNQPKPMTVADDAVVQLVHASVPVQTLTLGQVVDRSSATVVESAETRQVTHVLVEPPVVAASIRSLDADGGKVVVAVDGKERTFDLRRDLKIISGTRVKRLVDLQPNLAVKLVLTLDREQLLAIDVRPPGDAP